MVRIPSLNRATVLALVWLLAVASGLAADPATPLPPAAVNMIGLGREDVIALLGKPTGERQRGGELIMVYADGKRVVLRDGAVVAVSGGAAGEIIGADGAKYVPGADGTPVKQAPSAPAAPPAEVVVPEATKPAALVKPADLEAPSVADPDVPPGTEQVLPAGFATKQLEDHVEAMENPEEPEPTSPAKIILVFVVGVAFRFGLTVLVLRLAVHVIGVPFLWPDLLKVALLYLATHAFMEGLGALGGLWEFIPLFKLDDVVSFVILACSLTWFKVAGSGLTALKIAAATKFVVLGLMLAVGLALTFGLSSMQ